MEGFGVSVLVAGGEARGALAYFFPLLFFQFSLYFLPFQPFPFFLAFSYRVFALQNPSLMNEIHFPLHGKVVFGRFGSLKIFVKGLAEGELWLCARLVGHRPSVHVVVWGRVSGVLLGVEAIGLWEVEHADGGHEEGVLLGQFDLFVRYLERVFILSLLTSQFFGFFDLAEIVYGVGAFWDCVTRIERLGVISEGLAVLEPRADYLGRVLELEVHVAEAVAVLGYSAAAARGLRLLPRCRLHRGPIVSQGLSGMALVSEHAPVFDSVGLADCGARFKGASGRSLPRRLDTGRRSNGRFHGWELDVRRLGRGRHLFVSVLEGELITKLVLIAILHLDSLPW